MLSLLIFKAEVIGMENLKAVPRGTHNLISGSLQRLKKMGSDHISFYFIQLYKQISWARLGGSWP